MAVALRSCECCVTMGGGEVGGASAEAPPITCYLTHTSFTHESSWNSVTFKPDGNIHIYI